MEKIKGKNKMIDGKYGTQSYFMMMVGYKILIIDTG